jgi:hypothetical protein
MRNVSYDDRSPDEYDATERFNFSDIGIAAHKRVTVTLDFAPQTFKAGRTTGAFYRQIHKGFQLFSKLCTSMAGLADLIAVEFCDHTAIWRVS